MVRYNQGATKKRSPQFSEHQLGVNVLIEEVNMKQVELF